MKRKDKKRILALGAHPDDIEIGCGGTLLRYAEEGASIFHYIATVGEKGGDPVVRQREAARAAEMIGVERLFWGNFVDCEITNGHQLISSVEEVVHEVKPDRDDTHQDHRALAVAVQSAARRVPYFLFYESPTTLNFIPTVYCNIESTITRKIELLECHFSQVARTNIEGMPITDIARAAAIRRGIEVYRRYAEGFKTTRFFLL